MPFIHETYVCSVCQRRHLLYHKGDDPPDAGRTFMLVCPASGFAVRYVGVRVAWKLVAAQPEGTVEVQEMD